MTDQIVLYSNGNQESERMKHLLSTLHSRYHELNLGEHFTEKQFRQEFGDDAEYPQVAIGVRHIGGMKDTLQYLNAIGLVR